MKALCSVAMVPSLLPLLLLVLSTAHVKVIGTATSPSDDFVMPVLGNRKELNIRILHTHCNMYWLPKKRVIAAPLLKHFKAPKESLNFLFAIVSTISFALLRVCFAILVYLSVVGGNFTLGGRPSNLAQYDPTLKLWVDQVCFKCCIEVAFLNSNLRQAFR